MQDRQPFHLVSVKRRDEVVQHRFQQMIAKKKKRSECNNVPPESTDPGHSHAKSPRVGRIHVFLPLMDIHDCVSMRMGLILSQMPRLKERV